LKEKIFLIESKRAGHTSFLPGLEKKGYSVVCAPNGSSALTRLLDVDPDLVVIDAASLRTNGKRICQSIRQELDGVPIVLVLSTTDGEKVIVSTDKQPADAVLILPFTIQKLSNRIKSLLPGEGKKILHVGPIHLDVDEQKVRVFNQSNKLTPHLTRLLQLLMEKPGNVIKREELFRDVWETEYTEDTRTLDTHVSWLRRIIETDPRHPQYIKTVRGIGYRLDV
jgi:DNA-binding response OmpR family regulator